MRAKSLSLSMALGGKIRSGSCSSCWARSRISSDKTLHLLPETAQETGSGVGTILNAVGSIHELREPYRLSTTLLSLGVHDIVSIVAARLVLIAAVKGPARAENDRRRVTR